MTPEQGSLDVVCPDCGHLDTHGPDGCPHETVITCDCHVTEPSEAPGPVEKGKTTPAQNVWLQMLLSGRVEEALR